MAKRFLHTRELVKYLAPLYMRGRLLDLGAGRSKYKSLLPTAVTEYVACDNFDAPHIHVKSDAHALPFPDASFDTVLCTMVFEHVPRPWIVAAEIERVLRPGGIAIVTAPFMFPYHRDPEDFFRYTKPGMQSLFPRLKTLAVEGYGSWAAVVESSWRIAFCSPYEKRHGIIRRWIYQAVRFVFETLDRWTPPVACIYCNVYYLGCKEDGGGVLRSADAGMIKNTAVA